MIPENICLVYPTSTATCDSGWIQFDGLHHHSIWCTLSSLTKLPLEE